MVSCTAIEAQIVFETLLALVAGQLAIAGQLGREVYLWSIGLLLGSGEWRWFREGVLGRQGRRRRICLVLGGRDRTRGGSFSLLAFRSETRESLSLPALHSGVHGLVPSSGDRYSSLRHTYSGTRWVFLVSGWRWDPGSDWGAPGNNNGTGYYFPNLIGRHNT